MSHIIREGNRVIIRGGDKIDECIIGRIDGGYIYLQPIDGGDLFPVYFNGTDWFLDGDQIQVEFKSDPSMVQRIGDLNVMNHILSQLDCPDLSRMCETHKEMNGICQGDDLWRIKLWNDFGFSIATDKPLKQVYLELRRTKRNVNGANRAARNGNLEVLKWLRTSNLPNESQIHSPILPSQWGIDSAATNGHLEVLKWILTLDPNLLPSQDGINGAASGGHLELLKWLSELAYPYVSDSQIHLPILPDTTGANLAAGNGHLEVLEWSLGLDPQILPDHWGAYWAARRGHLNILKWLANLDPPIIPSQEGIDWAARNGYLEVLKWAQTLNPPILPTRQGVDLAGVNRHSHILNWYIHLTPTTIT